MRSSIQAKGEQLAHAKAADVLEKSLLARPSATELESKLIMKSPMKDRAAQLEKATSLKSLNHMLERRPTATELVEKNVLVQ